MITLTNGTQIEFDGDEIIFVQDYKNQDSLDLIRVNIYELKDIIKKHDEFLDKLKYSQYIEKIKVKKSE